MAIATISKKITKGTDDLVVIPRTEYEELLRAPRIVEVISMTASEKHALAQARKNYRQGKTMSLNELKQKLGFKN